MERKYQWVGTDNEKQKENIAKHFFKHVLGNNSSDEKFKSKTLREKEKWGELFSEIEREREIFPHLDQLYIIKDYKKLNNVGYNVLGIYDDYANDIIHNFKLKYLSFDYNNNYSLNLQNEFGFETCLHSNEDQNHYRIASCFYRGGIKRAGIIINCLETITRKQIIEKCKSKINNFTNDNMLIDSIMKAIKYVEAHPVNNIRMFDYSMESTKNNYENQIYLISLSLYYYFIDKINCDDYTCLHRLLNAISKKYFHKEISHNRNNDYTLYHQGIEFTNIVIEDDYDLSNAILLMLIYCDQSIINIDQIPKENKHLINVYMDVILNLKQYL